MNNRYRFFSSVFILLFALFILEGGEAYAHAEDEACAPDSGMDPELCSLLNQAMSSPQGLFKIPEKYLVTSKSPLETAVFFGEVGVRHILPGGLDHILFVLALFLASRRLRDLVLQITTFTVAHTVTLGLAGAGVIEPPASIVEPLIALSIAFVAVENIVFKDITRWRPLIIFGFGLFHGMGFAGFIKDVGLPDQHFWSALIGFNIGVEIGQLSVVLAAALIRLPLKRMLTDPKYSYREAVTIPVSAGIACVGLWWAVTRSLGL